MITCAGGETSGWSLYAKEGKLTFYYNFFDFEQKKIQAKEGLPKGKVTVKLEFVSKGTPAGRLYSDGAKVSLFVNGQLASEGELPKAANRHSVEPFKVGRDSISPASPD